MGLVTEVKKEDVFKREAKVLNPWLDPAFNKVEALGGEPGFKVDDIPERLGLVQEGQHLSSASGSAVSFYDLEDAPKNYGKKNQFLQTDGKGKLDWAWPFWSKAGSTVYYKSGKVAIGHAAAQTILHISTPLSSEIRIQTSGESDPTLSFKTTNTAHQVNFALDESAVADHVDFIGQTASVDTYFHVVGQVGQTAKVGVQIGSYRGELICGSAGHISLKNITADLNLILGIKDGAVNKTITWDAANDKLQHSAGLFNFDDDNILTTGTLGAGQTTLADSTIADDARGLSSIFTLSANPAKSDGIALYTEGHIGDITTDGPTYGGGIWLNIDSGATLGADVRALDIGIYERGADCTGGNAYGLAIHMDFDSTNSPAAIYPFRLNCEVSGATPDALIFAANKSALGVTEGDFPYNNYLKIVVQDGTVYRIPLITEGAAEFIAIHSNGEIRFYDNGNYVGFEAPALSADQIWVLPAADGPANEVLGTDNSGNLIWRTHDELAGFVSSEHLPALDEDNMVSDSDTNVATQQSIKAYVDALPAGVSTFVGLTDTPANYTGAASKVVAVNATPDALEFVDTLTLAGLTVADYIYFDSDTSHVIFLGFECGKNNAATGYYNFFAGEQAGYGNTTGDFNVAIGYQALFYNATLGQNVAIGYQALLGLSAGDTAYSANVGIGYEAGEWIKSGATGNVLLGVQAGRNIQTASYCMFIGSAAGYYQRGNDNVAIGNLAMRGVGDSLAVGNVNIGSRAGCDTVSGAAYNVNIGHSAGYFTEAGDYNVAIGYRAGQGVDGSSHFYNVFIGTDAGKLVSTASSCVMLGYLTGSAVTTGGDHVLLGENAGASLTTETGCVMIGHDAGQNATASNVLYIANSNTATPLIYGEFDNTLLKIYNYLYLPGIRSGVDQAGAGASAGELWKTASHASLPDNIVMIGV